MLRTHLTETPRASTAFPRPCDDLLHQWDRAGFLSFLLASELSGWFPDPSQPHLQRPVCGCGRWTTHQGSLCSLVSGPASPASHPPPLAAVSSRLGFALAVVLLENINSRRTRLSTYQLSPAFSGHCPAPHFAHLTLSGCRWEHPYAFLRHARSPWMGTWEFSVFVVTMDNHHGHLA